MLWLLLLLLIVVAIAVAPKKRGSRSRRPKVAATASPSGEPAAGRKRLVVEGSKVTFVLPEFSGCPPPEGVESHTDKGTFYEVDVAALTCTCPLFQREAKVLPPRDIRLLCKHIVGRLRRAGLTSQLPEIQRVILGEEDDPRESSSGYSGSVHDDEHLSLLVPGPGEVVIGYREGSDWVNVYARRRKKKDGSGPFTGPLSRYGYNLFEDRWAYGSGPPGGTLIRKVIRAALAPP